MLRRRRPGQVLGAGRCSVGRDVGVAVRQVVPPADLGVRASQHRCVGGGAHGGGVQAVVELRGVEDLEADRWSAAVAHVQGQPGGQAAAGAQSRRRRPGRGPRRARWPAPRSRPARRRSRAARPGRGARGPAGSRPTPPRCPGGRTGPRPARWSRPRRRARNRRRAASAPAGLARARPVVWPAAPAPGGGPRRCPDDLRGEEHELSLRRGVWSANARGRRRAPARSVKRRSARPRPRPARDRGRHGCLVRPAGPARAALRSSCAPGRSGRRRRR